MSDVFGNELESEEDLSLLQDGENFEPIQKSEDFVFPEKLFKAVLDYSHETLYVTVPDDMSVQKGDNVILMTRFGKDLAKILGEVKTPIGITPDQVVQVIRKATEADMKKAEELMKKEAFALEVFTEKVEKHNLDMKLISAHYLLDEPKVVFFFSADNRVDFRDLVKDLVSVFKMRIELRQVGVRDEARITGGLGPCGRIFCCHGVSDKLSPVSIRMAKDQNMSLNTLKISGQCGRLLCCLAFEHESYCEIRRTLPPEGTKIFHDGTTFRVFELNTMTRTIKLTAEDGRVLVIPADKVVLRNTKWTIK
ncbi:MAG: hypothetical protein IIW10_05715 [Spirochaetaceae bacterium]|nr:hypothetical protein [Spirochaetaceae bacterium]